MKEIKELAPDKKSEQRKFYESLKALSKSFQDSLNKLEELSVFSLMPVERLREEAELRSLVRHHAESLEDFRKRVTKAEEWQTLAGTKLGIEKFLKYLGYQKFRLERLRQSDPAKWNEVNLWIESMRATLKDTEYLRFILHQLKPAIAELHIIYEWHVPITAYEAYTNAQEASLEENHISFDAVESFKLYEAYTNPQEAQMEQTTIWVDSFGSFQLFEAFSNPQETQISHTIYHF